MNRVLNKKERSTKKILTILIPLIIPDGRY